MATIAPQVTGRTIGDLLTPLAITFPTAKKISGLGFTSLWKLAKENRIEIVRVGRRTLITYRSLEKLLLPDAPQERRRGRRRKHQACESAAT